MTAGASSATGSVPHPFGRRAIARQHGGFSKAKEERIMPGSRKTRPSGPYICLLLLAAAAFVAGCSTANETTPHPVGATWVTTSPAAPPPGHDAKAAPGDATGFSFCQFCH